MSRPPRVAVDPFQGTVSPRNIGFERLTRRAVDNGQHELRERRDDDRVDGLAGGAHVDALAVLDLADVGQVDAAPHFPGVPREDAGGAIDWLQIALLLLILGYLVGLRRGAPAGENPSALDGGVAQINERLDAIAAGMAEIRESIGEYEKDQEILDELQANVMTEWARIIEEELGKRPVQVDCPSCGYAGGLEPNLLADEDTEFGCPNCGAIATLDGLRERYPEADI